MKSYFAHLRPNKLMLSSGYLTWALVSFILLYNIDNLGDTLLPGGALFLYLVLFSSIVLREKPEQVKHALFILALEVLLVLWLRFVYLDNVIFILLILLATQLPAHFSKAKALIGLSMLNIFAYFLLQLSADPIGVFTLLTFAMFQLFAYSTIEVMLREQHAKEEISAINQQLIATRYMLKESARQKERLRISRDLHDVLGHQLTALALGLEITKHKVPDDFKAMAEQNHAQAKDLLKGVREVVKEMRHQEQFDLIQVFCELVEQLPNCQLVVENPPVVNSLKLKQQLIYCLQEGLSNGLRHARANKFILSSQRVNNRLTISLQNNGETCDNIIEGSGLTGMKERLAEFGASITLSPLNPGCLLAICVEDNYD